MVFNSVRNRNTSRVNTRAGEKGFSLMELLVVTTIFVVISSVMLASHSRFGGQIVLENMAYNIALSVRHAQLYGIAVRAFGSGTFDVAYGMHFSSPTTYVLFADSLTGNGTYDCPDPQNPSTCELVETTTIVGGHRITDLCIRTTGASEFTCGKSRIDILFRRPEPDAYIRAYTSGVTDGVLYEAAQIQLSSPRGQTRSVVVEQAGQISVQ